VTRFAPTLESAIEAGAVPPVLLVGLHNALGALGPRSDLRAQEYLPGHNRRRFDAHLRFVTGEVIPWADERFGPVAGPWVAAGFSNGAVWAIAAAQRHPDLIGAVAAFSAGVVPQRISGAARSARVRHYLAAGTLEPGFRRSTRRWAERLDKAGLPCRHEEWIGGHDQVWWEQQLPVALGWLLRA
jgi:enterochelin esterase-like enzyme